MRQSTPVEKLAHDLNAAAAECFPDGTGPKATVFRDSDGKEVVAVTAATLSPNVVFEVLRRKNHEQT